LLSVSATSNNWFSTPRLQKASQQLFSLI
jgi:hypothetical protein